MREEIKLLQEWMDNTGNIVVLTGPALSAESGVLDYRRMEEGYGATYKFPPEAILSRPFFERKPALFFDYYRERILAPLMTAEPTAAHEKLAELEAAEKLRAVITANIDGLHQDAGSRKVIELMGSVMRVDCPRCEQRLSALELYERPGVPYCDVDMCGGVMTPDVRLYGDAIDNDVLGNAIYYALTAKLFIVVGTSLLDYPAAAVVHHYTDSKLVLINETESPFDDRANLIIRAPASEVFAQLQVNPTVY